MSPRQIFERINAHYREASGHRIRPRDVTETLDLPGILVESQYDRSVWGITIALRRHRFRLLRLSRDGGGYRVTREYRWHLSADYRAPTDDELAEIWLRIA